MDESCQQIAELVITARNERGWSQRELARRANLSPTLISWIEQQKAHPKLVTLQRLATALDLPISQFVPNVARDLSVSPHLGHRSLDAVTSSDSDFILDDLFRLALDHTAHGRRVVLRMLPNVYKDCQTSIDSEARTDWEQYLLIRIIEGVVHEEEAKVPRECDLRLLEEVERLADSRNLENAKWLSLWRQAVHLRKKAESTPDRRSYRTAATIVYRVLDSCSLPTIRRLVLAEMAKVGIGLEEWTLWMTSIDYARQQVTTSQTGSGLHAFLDEYGQVLTTEAQIRGLLANHNFANTTGISQLVSEAYGHRQGMTEMVDKVTLQYHIAQINMLSSDVEGIRRGVEQWWQAMYFARQNLPRQAKVGCTLPRLARNRSHFPRKVSGKCMYCQAFVALVDDGYGDFRCGGCSKANFSIE